MDQKKFKEKFERKIKKRPNVIEKLKQMHGLEKDDLIFVLSNKDAFKQKFLIPHYKMYNTLQEINNKINELRSIQLTEEELKENLEFFNKKKLELAESKLEVYICNVMSGDQKALKTLANISMPYGLTHVGFLVDDICIQWGRGIIGKAIVNPSKDVQFNDYIFAIELDNKEVWRLIKETYNNITDYITGKKKYENMGTLKAFKICNSQLEEIAKISVDYNINKNYNLVFENCQQFVTRILDKINLKPDKNGEVGKFLKIVEDKCNVFDLKYKKNVFKKRQDLDIYVLQADFKKLPYDHRKLLFCFRNVFDFYLRNKPDDEKYQTSDLAKEYWSELCNWEKFK